MRSVPRILRIACAAAALPVVVNGCSGGGTEPARVATTVVITPSTASFTAIGQTQQFAAVVKDQNGNDMANATVSWSSSNTAAVSINSASGLATAVANGTAQVTATSGTARGDVSVTVAQVVASIAKVSGDAQTGTVAQALAQPLVVAVKDANNNPVANHRVNFTVTQGAGTLDAAADTTDASGQALITWTLGQTAGTNHQVSAAPTSGTAGSVTFTATANAATAANIAVVSGNGQSGQVATALGNAIIVRVADQFNNPVAGTTVTFAAAAGSGSVSPTSAASGATGQAQTTWTLGQTAGAQTMTASATGLSGSPVQFSAFAAAGPPASVAIQAGDNQTGSAGATLGTAPTVIVTDAFSNPKQGAIVTFAVASGGGSLVKPNDTTDASGFASVGSWTLGSAGTNTLTATVTGTGITGNPATFTATATPSSVSITSVTPDTLVEGQPATINGTGFSSTPASNTVTIGGVNATVSLASSTSMTVTVPSSDCLPARDAGVTVTVSSNVSNTVTMRLHPASLLNLAVGEQVILTDPTQFCSQFRPSATGSDAYIIGVGASAESPTGTLPYVLTGVVGAAAAPPSGLVVRPLPVPTVPSGAPMLQGVAGEVLARRRSHARAELALREWERRNLLDRPNARQQIAVRRAGDISAAPPSVGDTIRFRITSFSDPCNSFTEALTRVKVVGQRGVWVTDINNPATDSLTTAEIQGYSDTLDTHVYARDTTYFGAPSDLDNNQRIIIVLTIEVNKIPLGAAGFVFSGDLFSRSSCESSNLGEVFYSHVPDPGNVAGTGARSKSSILFQMPSLIAHEFTHNIQQSRRLVLASGQPMTSWEAEGQASLAEEVVGHSVLGNTVGQNYGASVAFASGLGLRWYGGRFQDLAMYYGWLPPGTSSKAADAPEMCTLFGSTSLTTSCDPFAFYGASWSFQRYLSDRFGPSYVGGEAALHRDWISKNVGLRGVPNVAALLGVSVDSLFAQWAATLYVDGRVASPPSPVSMSSWDLFNVFAAFVNDNLRLVPPNRTFANFSDSRSIRGGSTAYTRLSAAGARPAMALRVRDGSDNPLATTLKPQLWIVRLQ